MLTEHATILLLAILLDAVVGASSFIWRYIPHPHNIIQQFIAFLELRYNRRAYDQNQKRRNGLWVMILLILVSGSTGFLLDGLVSILPWKIFWETLIVGVLLSQRRFFHKITDILFRLSEGGMDAARELIAKIVGRDTENLSKAGVCRATIEACTRNLSKGMIAPAFWFLIFGLTGLIIYKVVETADAMIGHFDPRYRNFGFWTAKIDDLANFIPSRLTAILIILLASLGNLNARKSLQAIRMDAKYHRSPNQGWPEAATAGALDLALSGPRSYGGIMMYDHWMNETGRKSGKPADIIKAIDLCLGVVSIILLLLTLLVIFM